VTAGNYNMRVWRFSRDNRKLHPTDVVAGQLRRKNQCLAIDPSDKCLYCGTETGDLLRIKLDESRGEPNPRFDKAATIAFGRGVICTKAMEEDGNCYVAVGAGDGTIAIVQMVAEKSKKPTKVIATYKVMGGVTSIAMQSGKDFYIGTNQGNTYLCSQSLDKEPELQGTCHYGQITDVVFPKGCSSLFVTSSVNDIRI